ncbi:hypothetical protein [Agromyces sp. Soil535]|uniref:hypothetical protein n=1 Tax=Agromyces sp. Soil535 TaxID=1736390 RepID=UPI0006FEEB19|nr:hypothetical protein [Agromyces sp. Soil535]KRE30538.1 hypothetical protein ASG80_17520 [Agromyces sp. Soil535]
MRPNAAVVATASVIVLALTGCSVAAAESTPTPPASETPTPVASVPLTCDDLVPADLVADTLEGADGVPVEPVVAAYQGAAFDSILLEGVGGLACSWRVGSGMPEYNAPSDWAYLSVEVLPGAAAQYAPLLDGEGLSTETRQIAGIEASFSFADPGWAISAPVADSWVRTMIVAAARSSTGTRFGTLGGPVVIDRLADVAASAFTELEQADAAQLAGPAVELRQGDAICDGGLDEQGIVAAMQLPAGSTVEYVMSEPMAEAPRSFDEAVHAAARTFTCELQVDGSTWVTISTARGFAPLFDRLLAPDADAGFTASELADAPAHARAVANSEGGRASRAFLTDGHTLYRIQGYGAQAVAQAIIHQTY